MKAKKKAEVMEKAAPLFKELSAAKKKGENDKVLETMDKIIALDAEMFSNINMMKFEMLLTEKKDYAAAYKLGGDLVSGSLKDNAEGLNSVAWTIVDGEGIEKRDLDLAMKAATRAAELSKWENAAILDTLARVYWEQGDAAKAVELQKKAVGKCEEGPMKDELEANLKKYTDGKK